MFYHTDLILMVEYRRERSKWHLPLRNEEDAQGQRTKINLRSSTLHGD